MNFFPFFIGIFDIIYPESAQAHGFGQVYTLPVPFSYYLIAGILTLSISFFYLIKYSNRNEQETRLQQEKIILIQSNNTLLQGVRIVAVAIFLLTIFAGIFGNQTPIFNFAPVFIWVYFIVGMGILNICLGNTWKLINPLETIQKFFKVNIAGKTKEKKLGIFSVLFIFLLFWFELIAGVSFIPSMLGFAILGYSIITIIGSLTYKEWFTYADPFSVLYNTLGKLAPYKLEYENKKLFIQKNTYIQSIFDTPKSSITFTLFFSVILAGTTFDAFKETSLWFSILETFGYLEFGMPDIFEIRFPSTIAFIIICLLFFISYQITISAISKITNKSVPKTTIANYFTYSVAPIGFGYIIAHTFTLLFTSFPVLVQAIRNPFGIGNPELTIGSPIILGAKVVWWGEIGFILLGHVFAVWIAHRIAIRLFKDSKLAIRTQYPMFILMVIYTITTLWLLSQPFMFNS